MENNWKGLAIGLIYYGQGKRLSMVDFRPGRFAIWWEVREEKAKEVVGVLKDIFLERGLLD